MTHDQHELLAHIETALATTEQRAQAARVDLDGVAAARAGALGSIASAKARLTEAGARLDLVDAALGRAHAALEALEAETARIRAAATTLASLNPPDDPPIVSDRGRRIHVGMVGASEYQGEHVVMELGAALEAAMPGDTLEHVGGRQLGYFSRLHPINPSGKMLGFERVLRVRSGTARDPIRLTVAPGARVEHDGSELPNGQRLDNRKDGKEIYHPALLWLGKDTEGGILEHWHVDRWGVYRSLGYGVRLEGHHMRASLVWGEDNHAEPVNLGGDSYSTATSPAFKALNPIIEACGGVRNASYRNGGDSADAVKVAHSLGGIVRGCLGGLNSDDFIDGISASDLLIEDCLGFGSGCLIDEAGVWSKAPTGNGQGYKLGGPSSHRVTVRRSAMIKARRIAFTDNGGHDVDIIACREALSASSYNIKCDATDEILYCTGMSPVVNQGRKINECPDGAPGQVVGYTLLKASDYRSLDLRELLTGNVMALTEAAQARVPAEARWEWSAATLAGWRDLVTLHKVDLDRAARDLAALPL